MIPPEILNFVVPWTIAFVLIRAMYLLAFVPVLLLLRYAVRLEWNRAGLAAGIVCALGFGVLSIPFGEAQNTTFVWTPPAAIH